MKRRTTRSPPSRAASDRGSGRSAWCCSDSPSSPPRCGGGAEIGVAFRFWPDLALIILCGSTILAAYVTGLGYVGYRSGLSTALSARFAFGDAGSRWSDALLGLTQIGWYAWGTATIAIILVRLLNLGAGGGRYP
ncbi:cytosine permease [Methanoculleus chikugoensis]|uniref:cytosine permease n=1 Tax=Methanoculleus chikugoensis TaxID=118126 RepID=UPI0006D168CE|nr:cytosine permease [Methanoculleus chikugoensis]